MGGWTAPDAGQIKPAVPIAPPVAVVPPLFALEPRGLSRHARVVGSPELLRFFVPNYSLSGANGRHGFELVAAAFQVLFQVIDGCCFDAQLVGGPLVVKPRLDEGIFQ